MDLKSSAEKEKILQDEYNIELTRDMKKELGEMGGLMEPLLKIVAEQAAEKAPKKAIAETEKRTLI